MINKTYKDWIIEKTKLDNVVKIIPTVFKDFRGEYIETYNKDFMIENEIDIDFLQDDVSVSKKNVLRGLHFQKKFPQGKLVKVVKGEIFDVIVDLRKNKKSFGKYLSFRQQT